MRRAGTPSLLSTAVSAALVLLTSCSSGARSGTPSLVAAASQWVVSWGAPPENAGLSGENTGGREQTFRFFFYPTVEGATERLHFSNFFGTGPVTIGSARLAVATTPPAIDTSHDAPVLFGGKASVTIAPGEEVTSDPVALSYTFGQKLAVSVYMQGTFAPLTQHDSQSMVNFASAADTGDTTNDAGGASFTGRVTEWYLLSGMDVYGEYQGTVAILGSSTVDGHASDYGDTNAYPVPNAPVPGQDNQRPSDILARALHAAGYRLGVLNAGILGDSAGPGTGLPNGSSGVDRIGRDVLRQAGIKTVIIYLGQVDLRLTACGEATEVETSLQEMVSQAQAAEVRVVLATIPPASYCTLPSSPNFGPFPNAGNPFAGDINPGPENPGNQQRHLVNTWIRSTGAALPGVVGVADFEAALEDPAHPDFLVPNWNSGDNFHPDGAGYQAQNNAIPLDVLLPK